MYKKKLHGTILVCKRRKYLKADAPCWAAPYFALCWFLEFVRCDAPRLSAGLCAMDDADNNWPSERDEKRKMENHAYQKSDRLSSCCTLQFFIFHVTICFSISYSFWQDKKVAQSPFLLGYVCWAPCCYLIFYLSVWQHSDNCIKFRCCLKWTSTLGKCSLILYAG